MHRDDNVTSMLVASECQQLIILCLCMAADQVTDNERWQLVENVSEYRNDVTWITEQTRRWSNVLHTVGWGERRWITTSIYTVDIPKAAGDY